jgi:putative GTP pyrophosphokinase
VSRSRSNKTDSTSVEEAIRHFEANRGLFESFAQALMGYFRNDAALSSDIHFLKYRIKDTNSLRKKLIRKASEGQIIDASNLFDNVTDLAGIRLIHLHTQQIRGIHKAVSGIFHEQQLRLIEPPTANCWDVEYQRLFHGFGLETRSRDSMYTTIHYVVRANQKTNVTCEIQVRTLMDEVWGEVSHSVNYPEASKDETCQNLLKVLARLTTGCTRLVDSIFTAHSQSSE